MQFINNTPFPSITFQARDQHRQPSHVAVMRVTLDMQANGALELSREQAPLVLIDEFFGEPNKSSVRQESDLVPFKPRCDVIVNATAYAPGGRQSPRFTVGVSINGPSLKKKETGPVILKKELIITGQRCWEKGMFRGWKLLQFTKPITSLPIRYEHTFGGECRVNSGDPNAKQVDPKYLLTQEQIKQHPDSPDNAPVAHTVCESNPIGMGFVEPWYLKATKLQRLMVPQIECGKNPVLEIDRPYPPQGFGVITRSWQPRIKLAGTYDDSWLEQRWPDLPDDFDFSYLNGAHPDMQIPYLNGNETIELTNLMPPGAFPGVQDKQGNSVVRFALPGCKPHLLAQFENGEKEPVNFNIDTLVIDTEKRNFSLIYRAVMPEQPEILELEAKIIGNAVADQQERV